MKRTALILLTVIYLSSLVGVAVNRFYCCGKLASVTITYGASDSNGDKSAKKDHCCKHKIQNFKVNDSHFNVASFSFDHPLPAIIPGVIHLDNDQIFKVLPATVAYNGNAPPGYSNIPVYTLNCTYRI